MNFSKIIILHNLKILSEFFCKNKIKKSSHNINSNITNFREDIDNINGNPLIKHIAN